MNSPDKTPQRGDKRSREGSSEDHRSPTSLAEEFKSQWRQIPGAPALFSSSPSQNFPREHSDDAHPSDEDSSDAHRKEEIPPKALRFATEESTIIDTSHSYEFANDIWWAKDEIKAFQKNARDQARQFRDSQMGYATDLGTFFQECKNTKSLQACVNSSTAKRLKRFQGTTSSPGSTPVRGLEGTLNATVSQSRVYHIRSLLAIQKACPSRVSESLSELLRCRSRQTSRASRALALLLAQRDYINMLDMVREELASPSSFDDMIE